jgi:anthranilate phosphoribosyltransferase
MTDVPAFNEVFAQLATSEGLAPRTVEQVFGAILAGAWTPAQIAGLLIGMRLRGETAPQIAAAARAMRAAMVPVEHGFDRTLDTCGTGGDGQGTVNISTGAAIIAAACGIPVAKHGNRAVSSQSGSADILQALGIPTDLPPGRAGRVLQQAGIAFLLAPAHHPAMKHAAPVRQELRVRTIFNILGPLSNPARVTHQLLGAFDDALRPVLAKTLDELGVQRAWVVRGADGLDEISPYGPTLVSELAGGTIRELSVSPSDFGVETSPAGAARGGDAEANAQILLRVLAGEDHPARSAFVLNAAAAIAVADGDSLPDAARRADEALRSGAARSRLDAWRSAALAAREA